MFIRFTMCLFLGRKSVCECASFTLDLRVGCGICLYKFLVMAFLSKNILVCRLVREVKLVDYLLVQVDTLME